MLNLSKLACHRYIFSVAFSRHIWRTGQNLLHSMFAFSCNSICVSPASSAYHFSKTESNLLSEENQFISY